jgi:outer membrane protein TolC
MKRFLIFVLIAVMIGLSSVSAEEASLKKEITLQEGILFALKNNLDLQVEMTNTEYFWNTLKINRSIFVPSFEVTLENSETNSPATSVFAGADVNTSDRTNLNFKLSQTLPIGGTFEVSLQNTRRESNNIYETVNPSLNSVLTFSFSQPLLQGFGTLSTKRDIYIATNDYQKYKHQLKQSIIDLVYSVEEAYWNLVYSYKNLEATKTALDRSRDFLRQNEIKVKVGTAAPIDILEAQAEVASFESQVIQAERAIQTSEENLKKILNMSKMADTLYPTDIPEVKIVETNFEDYLLEALENRPDIEKARLDLENYNIYVKYYKNQMLPNLQLTASYYTTGTGGDVLIFDDNPFFGGQVIDVIGKDIWETLEDNVANLFRNYSIGLTLSVPLSFSKERAQLAQAKINLKKGILDLKNVENTIYSDVRLRIKELESNLKLVEANRAALNLELERLKAEQKKLAVGLSTNFQVLTYQRQLANTETLLLRSVLDYTLSVASLNRILARTFKVHSIKLNEFLEEH